MTALAGGVKRFTIRDRFDAIVALDRRKDRRTEIPCQYRLSNTDARYKPLIIFNKSKNRFHHPCNGSWQRQSTEESTYETVHFKCWVKSEGVMFSECAENEDETEFLFTHLQQQLAVIIIHNCSLSTNASARNLGFICDNHLTFSDQISALSQSFYYHNRKLRCIRHYIDFKTASFIATSVAHSKLLCTTAFQKSQLSRLQVIIFITVLPGLWLRLPSSVMPFLLSNCNISLNQWTFRIQSNFLLPTIYIPCPENMEPIIF